MKVPQCSPLLFACLAAAFVLVPPAHADSPLTEVSPEGFGASLEGLPHSAHDAWYATVLVTGRAIVRPEGKEPRWRTKHGSGFVVSFDDDTNEAVVATSAHVVTCAGQACSVGVGFSDSESPTAPMWSDSVRVISRDTSKDLAFLEVEIPTGTELRAVRFGTAECTEPGVKRVMSIGWPDLSIRREWGVPPPSNHRERVKRHSDGYFLLWKNSHPAKPEVNRLARRSEVVFHNADMLPGSSGGPLLNENGEVVGINTMVISSAGVPDYRRFCARPDPQDPGECIHVAISSKEVVAALERLTSSRIAVPDCSPPPEFEMGR
jgi:S1-C subfamily serine protease